MEPIKHVMFYELRKGIMLQDEVKIFIVFIETDCINERKNDQWFERFRKGYISLRESLKTGYPVALKDDLLLSEQDIMLL